MTVISKAIDNKPSLRTIALKGIIAAVVAAVINIILYLIGGALGSFPDDVLTPMGQPIQLSMVAIMTVGGGIAATVGYYVLLRFLSVRMATIALWALGILVLIVMYFGPGSLEGLPTSGFIILQIMHFVAGLLPLANLTR